jgi:hypothetical protein
LGTILEQENLSQLTAYNHTDLYSAIDPYCEKLQELSLLQTREVEIMIAQAEATNHNMRLFLLGILAIGLILAGIIGYSLSRLVGDLVVLVGEVQRSGVQVNTSITEIASTAREQQATASEVAATSNISRDLSDLERAR